MMAFTPNYINTNHQYETYGAGGGGDVNGCNSNMCFCCQPIANNTRLNSIGNVAPIPMMSNESINVNNNDIYGNYLSSYQPVQPLFTTQQQTSQMVQSQIQLNPPFIPQQSQFNFLSNYQATDENTNAFSFNDSIAEESIPPKIEDLNINYNLLQFQQQQQQNANHIIANCQLQQQQTQLQSSNNHTVNNNHNNNNKPGKNKLKMEKYLNAFGRYECNICYKSYARYNDLRGHFVIHDEKTPKCPYCCKRFSRPIYLRDHIRSHRGEKPFKCTICHRRFTAKRNLTYHMKTHDAEKPLQCSICKKSFKDNECLQKHIKENHE